MPTVVSGDLVHLPNMALLRQYVHLRQAQISSASYLAQIMTPIFKALLDVWINCLVELTIPVDAKELRIMSPTGRGVPHVPDLCVA